MEAENYGKRYLEEYRWGKEYGIYEDGCALLAAKQLYEADGEETYFSLMKNYMDSFLTEDGGIGNCMADTLTADCVHSGRTLFFLYDKTGEEKYRKALEAIMSGLRAYPRSGCGNFAYSREQPEERPVDALYRIQPFYMEYETLYDKKEKYNDIIKQFENAQKMLCGEEKGQIRSTARYLAALVDTMENMSVEIYEQYRKLQDMFKAALKDALAQRAQDGLFHAAEGIDVFAGAVIGYCTLKACRMGLLLKEKYVGTGMEIVEKLAEKLEPEDKAACDTETVCAFLAAYGQYRQTEKEME
ncbi:MAG: glycoside hydrolase family 88 protein [Blautia sp.]|nr:glycoside hydrolase family 88 protein [Blautia sp.]MCM1201104.1 glycoside hydrolase family 88 protein [Bacteroides fragilis]